MSDGSSAAPAQSPLFGDSPAWSELIEAVGPAAMLVRIESRMSERLKRSTTAEDIWQETLLHAWRDRQRCEWQGPASFRRWLLEIAENRIRDAVDRNGAQKRSGVAEQAPGGAGSSAASTPSSFGGAFVSTTPSRSLVHREQAELMRAALAALAPGLREVVQRRLFEEQGLDEIASAMELSHAAIKHRLRKGSILYRERLRALLGSRSSTSGANP